MIISTCSWLKHTWISFWKMRAENLWWKSKHGYWSLFFPSKFLTMAVNRGWSVYVYSSVSENDHIWCTPASPACANVSLLKNIYCVRIERCETAILWIFLYISFKMHAQCTYRCSSLWCNLAMWCTILWFDDLDQRYARVVYRNNHRRLVGEITHRKSFFSWVFA